MEQYGGLLGQLAAAPADAAASSGTNIMEEMAMNMAQQQIEQMLSSGELENMAMEFMSSGQMEAEWEANGGLMGMMGMTGDDMKQMMQMMEMKAHCQCTSSNVAYGQMAMPTMAPAGRK